MMKAICAVYRCSTCWATNKSCVWWKTGDRECRLSDCARRQSPASTKWRALSSAATFCVLPVLHPPTPIRLGRTPCFNLYFAKSTCRDWQHTLHLYTRDVFTCDFMNRNSSSLKACPHCCRKLRQSHFGETVSLFCDSVDRPWGNKIYVCMYEESDTWFSYSSENAVGIICDKRTITRLYKRRIPISCIWLDNFSLLEWANLTMSAKSV